MKVNWKKIFSLSVSEEQYFNDQKDKIEYVGCNLSGESCLNYLPAINAFFRESDLFYRAKDFNRAINALEKAYNVAAEIQEPDCQSCAVFFRATVIQSLENIHYELERMAKGIFPTKRYQSSCMKAEMLLGKFKAQKEIKPEYSTNPENITLQPAYL